MAISKSVWERLRAAGIIDTYDKEARNRQIRKAGPWKLMKIAGIGPRIAKILLNNAGWEITLKELEEIYDKLWTRTEYQSVKAEKKEKKEEKEKNLNQEAASAPPKPERKRRYICLTVNDSGILRTIFRELKKSNAVPYNGEKPHKILHITLDAPKDLLMNDALARLDVLEAFDYPLHFIAGNAICFPNTGKLMYEVKFPFRIRTATPPHMTIGEFEEQKEANSFLADNAELLNRIVGQKMGIEALAIVAKDEGIEYALPVMSLQNIAEKFLPVQIRDFLGMLHHEKPIKYQVFRPSANGVKQGSGRNTYVNSAEEFISLAEMDNGKGIICVAIGEHGDKGTEDISNIVKLLALVIDVDVKKERKMQHVSSRKDHLHAIAIAYTYVKKELERMGFKVGMINDSGNGAHVIVKVGIALPADITKESWQQSGIYLKLVAIEQKLREGLNKLDDDAVSIDFITKDAVRRIKTPGTLNMKDTAQAENRMCRTIYRAEDYGEEQNNGAFSRIKPAEKEIHRAAIAQPTGNEPVVADNEIKSLLEKDEKVRVLYEGKIICHGQDKPLKFENGTAACKSRSEAELALVSELVRLGVRNFEQVDKIMMSAGIGKWQEDSRGAYKQRTFEKAFSSARSTKTHEKLSPVDRLMKSITKVKK